MEHQYSFEAVSRILGKFSKNKTETEQPQEWGWAGANRAAALQRLVLRNSPSLCQLSILVIGTQALGDLHLSY